MSQTTQLETRRVKPNWNQVTKIRKQLDGLIGLNTDKKIDFVFDGINSWEQGYNLATITLGFYPDSGELIDNVEYAKREAMLDMKVKLRQYRNSTQCRFIVLYPSRGKGGKGEWRYFNMQTLDEFDLVHKMDLSIIIAIKKWIKTITTILNENPEYRNKSHKKQVSEIRYDLMVKRRMLKRLEKRKRTKLTQKGEQQNDETDEK